MTPYFNSIGEFFAMGGHGAYVWASYGIMLFVVLWNLVAPLYQQKKIRQQLRQRLAIQPQGEPIQ